MQPVGGRFIRNCLLLVASLIVVTSLFAAICLIVDWPGGAKAPALTDRAADLKAAAMIALCGGSLAFVVLLMGRLAEGELPRVETHWGGFGGSLGGWQLSEPLVYLIGAVALGALAAAAVPETGPNRNRDNTSQGGNSTTTPANPLMQGTTFTSTSTTTPTSSPTATPSPASTSTPSPSSGRRTDQRRRRHGAPRVARRVNAAPPSSPTCQCIAPESTPTPTTKEQGRGGGSPIEER